MNNSQDRRVLKTRRAIREALLTLLQDHALEEISVVSLAETAMINRKTFYAHYSRVEDVARDLMNDFALQVTAYLEQEKSQNKEITPATFAKLLADGYTQYPDLFRAVFTAPNYGFLSLRIQHIIRREIMRNLNIPRRSPRHSHMISFFVSGLFGAYRDWIQYGQKIPLDELTALLSRIVASSLSLED